MQKENQVENNRNQEINQEDLAKLFNYPSIGELFSQDNPQRLNDFCARLNGTRENLDRIIRYGTREEADRATRAANAVRVTVDFLQSLQKMRVGSK